MNGALDDTICGVATPVGEGGIGIVRLSGPDAVAVAERIVRLRSNRPLGSVASHTVHLADVVFPRKGLGNGEPVRDSGPVESGIIDEGLVLIMRGPRSFTAEDVVELHCHGNKMILGLVCQACVAGGARLAEPGEFTKRAFLNGRLDLSQAEAVLETIRAKSEAGVKMAQRHLRGELGRQVGEFRLRLVELLAKVEAGIDFGEEDIAFVGQEEMIGSLEEILRGLQRMRDSWNRGRMLREGARVVIVGRPNVGKSSLLNSLLGEERAIVTDVAGTTRDVIAESVVWDGLMVTLVDTAGLRETEDVVEQEGMKRTRSAMGEGDVVVLVEDASEEIERDGESTAVMEGCRTNLVVMNKSDLVDDGTLAKRVQLAEARCCGRVIVTSVRTGAGLDVLREEIRGCVSQPSFEPNGGAVVTNVRHRHALERAEASIEESLKSLQKRVEPEFVVVDLREAADALGEVTGAITSDEILERIFAQFCIGK